MKKILILLIAILVANNLLKAQEKGIHFEKAQVLGQAMNKAIAEHKYLFIDCYATWCGPCKEMDRSVYTNDTVGSYMNAHFISIRLQMDKTSKDDDTVKRWRDYANGMAINYNITAYPTFLFFDPDGKPVHKFVGFRDAKQFLQLAQDAQNPGKQYYRILKDFKPGTIDTAELGGLAGAVYSFDKHLAGKLALDYLTRIPRKEYDLPDKRNFMMAFSDINSQIVDLATSYISKLEKRSILKETDMDFISQYNKYPKIAALTKNYIDHLSANQLYDKNTLLFIAAFTDQPTDRGFKLFYNQAKKINAIMKNNYFAADQVIQVITKEKFTPVFEAAKQSEMEPDWKTISITITKKYNASYSNLIITNSKLAWFSYLARTKKKDQYWPEYITYRIKKVEQFRYDTVASINLNDFAWEIFDHGEKRDQLMIAVKWMKDIISRNAKNSNVCDTYANLLYKIGQTEEALKWEKQAVEINPRDKGIAEDYKKMQAGEATWSQNISQ